MVQAISVNKYDIRIHDPKEWQGIFSLVQKEKGSKMLESDGVDSL